LNNQFLTKARAALVLCAAFAACGAAAADAADGLQVGPYFVEMASMGKGPYTVIFESGFAGDLSVWQKVAPNVAGLGKVVVYSRAGIGKSAPRPEARTPERSSAELEQLIEAAQLKPPFILVGHSYGGYLIRLFAARHPEQVAGMVFVDPSMEGFNSALRKIDAARLEQDLRLFDSLTPAPFKAEAKLVDAAFDAAARRPVTVLPDVPVVVLTSTMVRANPEFFMHTAPAVAAWRRLHAQLFSQFSSGSHVVTASSGHNIHLEEPALVTSAIGQVMAAAGALAQQRAHQAARGALMRKVEESAALLKTLRAPEAERTLAEALKASGFSEGEINKLGYDVQRTHPAVAALVMKWNAEANDGSANAHDSYGEVLLDAGHAAQAREQFRRALALGTAAGKSARTLEGYRTNLARADKALGAAP
jgi:pimeloyl-ACP methyl ester carboxylesterase